MASKAVSYLDRAILPIRILFGALFLYTSLWHGMHGAKFLQSIRDYQIVPGSLVPWSGFLFIALEAGVGIALVFGYLILPVAIAAAGFLSGVSLATLCVIVLGVNHSLCRRL